LAKGTDTFISILAKVAFRLLCFIYNSNCFTNSTRIVCGKLYYQFAPSFLDITKLAPNFTSYFLEFFLRGNKGETRIYFFLITVSTFSL
jgi:hypothetical protein